MPQERCSYFPQFGCVYRMWTPQTQISHSREIGFVVLAVLNLGEMVHLLYRCDISEGWGCHSGSQIS